MQPRIVAEARRHRGHFLSLMIQLEIVSAGETVHVIGNAREALRVLKRQRAVAVCHPKA